MKCGGTLNAVTATYQNNFLRCQKAKHAGNGTDVMMLRVNVSCGLVLVAKLFGIIFSKVPISPQVELKRSKNTFVNFKEFSYRNIKQWCGIFI